MSLFNYPNNGLLTHVSSLSTAGFDYWNNTSYEIVTFGSSTTTTQTIVGNFQLQNAETTTTQTNIGLFRILATQQLNNNCNFNITEGSSSQTVSIVANFSIRSGPTILTEYLAANYITNNSLTINENNKISAWKDFHDAFYYDGVSSHIAVQSQTGFQPLLILDTFGNSGVLFNYDYPTHPSNRLIIPDSLSGLNTNNLSMYVVCSTNLQTKTQSYLSISGVSSPWGFSQSVTGSAGKLYLTSRASEIYPPINKSVLSFVANSSNAFIGWNTNIATVTKPGLITTGYGGAIGGFSSYNFDGIIYQLLIYKTGHSYTDCLTNINQLISDHEIINTYSETILCRGDSITEGVKSSFLSGYPSQLYTKLSDKKIYNLGIGGSKINTYTGLDSYINTAFSTGNTNYLVVNYGINDMNSDAISANECYSRLNTFLGTITGYHPDITILPTTLIANTTAGTKVDTYNNLLRTGIYNIIDFGKGSSIESRLSDSTDTDYIIDGTHPTNLGYKVIADNIYNYFRDFINKEDIVGNFRISASQINNNLGQFVIISPQENSQIGNFNVQQSQSNNIDGNFRISASQTNDNIGQFIVISPQEVSQVGNFRISQTQEQSITGLFDISLPGNTISTILGRFNILVNSTNNQDCNFRVSSIVESSINGNFRISTAQSITNTGLFIIQTSQQNNINGNFVVNASQENSITGLFSIVAPVENSINGNFVISANTRSNIIGSFVISGQTEQTINGAFYIVHSQQNNINGNFRLISSSSHNINGYFTIQGSTIETILPPISMIIKGFTNRRLTSLNKSNSKILIK